MTTTINTLRTLVFTAMIAAPLGSVARAAEEKALRPEIEQLTQSVGERLQAAAEKLGLTNDQREKIAAVRSSHADQLKALRAERQSLLRDELKAISSILTPAQRDKVTEFAEDRMEQAEQAAAPGLPRFVIARATLAERVEAAGDKLGITSEQRKQIAPALARHAEQHAVLKIKCRDATENEFKAIAAFLNPDQREQARDVIELRVVRAEAASSIADRLEAAADKLGLSADQRRQIAKVAAPFASKYSAMRSDRRELLEDEMKKIAAVLTPEQREKTKDFCEDRIIVTEVRTAGREGADRETGLGETITERLEAAADGLGLTADQRSKVRAINSQLADKFKVQREQRRALRADELKAIGEILTPQQREKVKDFVEDRS